MCQDRKPEAGKQKHNHSELLSGSLIEIVRSVISFVLWCGLKNYLTPQLWRFTFSFNRILHFTCSFGKSGLAWQKDFEKG
jgi:hypothetical protein